MTTALTTLVSLAGLCLLYLLYRDYRIDRFRQSMFELRDRLFDEALAGRLPFDHRAYGIMRTTMNGYIRFAHRLQILSLLIFMFRAGKKNLRVFGEATFDAALENAARDLHPDVRVRLCQLKDQMHLQVLAHLIFSSLVLTALCYGLALVFVVLFRVGKSVTVVLKRCYHPFVGNLLDPAALSVGGA